MRRGLGTTVYCLPGPSRDKTLSDHRAPTGALPSTTARRRLIRVGEGLSAWMLVVAGLRRRHHVRCGSPRPGRTYCIATG